MKKMKWMHELIFALVVIGALNWGLIGAFNFNLVTFLFGTGSLARAVYILVGLAALVKIFKIFGKRSWK